MKILHVVPTYYPAVRYGGPIASVHGLASALAGQGHEVHVYTTNVDGERVSAVRLDRPTQLDGVNVSYFATGIGRRLYRSPGMRKALAVHVASFDLVHLHSVFLWPTWAAARAARKEGVPYVVSPRGMLVEDLIRRKSFLAKRSWIALFERRNIENAAAIHFTSEVEASEFKALGFQCARGAVVANGIDRAATNLRQGRPGQAAVDGRPYVLFLGRLNWKKGLDRLIPAMAEVRDANLLIAGNDEENYRPELEALARRCGVLDRVRFLGPVHGDDKWTLLASARLLALPSYSENFGNVILEAMTVGCPVIVTPEVGLASVVHEARCGVVARGDPENFGREMSRLLKDRDLCEAMGRAGRLLVESSYSWSSIARQMLDLYTDVVTPNGGPRQRKNASWTPGACRA